MDETKAGYIARHSNKISAIIIFAMMPP